MLSFLPSSALGLVNLSRVYEALTALGGFVEREYVRFGDWPLQILTDANDLIHEAIAEALPTTYEETPTRVFRPEHLCAIALQTGRTKDNLRVRMFLEQAAVDREALLELLRRFGLDGRLSQVG